MNTAQLTPRAQAVIAASDEYTAPIFRAPSVGGSGGTVAQFDAADLVRRAIVKVNEIEGAIYSPRCEDLREILREISNGVTTTGASS